MKTTFAEYGLGTPKMFKPLTDNQKSVLAHMDDRNIGALWFDGRYRFPVEIRDYPDLADSIATALSL